MYPGEVKEVEDDKQTMHQYTIGQEDVDEGFADTKNDGDAGGGTTTKMVRGGKHRIC